MIEHSTDFVIRELTTNQHEEVVALLASVDGIVVRGADQENGLKRYLERNPGTSFSAVLQGRTVGCILSGHDGRRGYIYHLAVAPDCRLRGIARALVQHCTSALHGIGIEKIHLDVLDLNLVGQAFWEHLGWTRRREIVRFSKICGDDLNA